MPSVEMRSQSQKKTYVNEGVGGDNYLVSVADVSLQYVGYGGTASLT